MEMQDWIVAVWAGVFRKASIGLAGTEVSAGIVWGDWEQHGEAGRAWFVGVRNCSAGPGLAGLSRHVAARRVLTGTAYVWHGRHGQ